MTRSNILFSLALSQHARWHAPTTALSVLLATAGCLPWNAGASYSAPRESIGWIAGAEQFREPDVEDAVWLSVRFNAETEPVGGYLSDRLAAEKTLVLICPGASTFHFGGMPEKARDYHGEFARNFREAGLRTWVLSLPECATPYGRENVLAILDAVDWLNAAGRDALGIERIYLIGFSSGATAAAFAALERPLSGTVLIAGLYQPDQLQQWWLSYRILAEVFRGNAAFCQLNATLVEYGWPWSRGWDELDLPGRIHELQGPTLAIHARGDNIYPVENTLALQAAYSAALAAGAALPPMEFVVLSDGAHGELPQRPEVVEKTLRFILDLEAASQTGTPWAISPQ